MANEASNPTMVRKRLEAYAAITLERESQCDQWSVENDKKLSIADWILLIQRRLDRAKHEQMIDCCKETPRGKLDAGAYEKQWGTADPKKQLMKVAAMCVAALESLPD